MNQLSRDRGADQPHPVMGTTGDEIFRLAAALFPVTRSITGQGVRDTLRHMATYVPIEQREVPTGTAVFDWTIPKEWVIRDAFIEDESGRRIVDLKQSNL